MTRLMSVLLPDPLDPTSAVVDPAGAGNDTCFSTGTPALYSNVTSSNSISPRTSGIGRRLASSLIFGRHLPDFADAVEAGERLGHLRADGRQLDHRHRDERDHRQIPDEVADRHRARADRRAADEHHRDADGADDEGRERADRRHAGQRLRDVAEQPVRALREDELLALFRRVRLDDADAAERFGEPAGDLGVDLAALAERAGAGA